MSYEMGFRQPVETARVEAFLNGELSLNEIVVLMQDIIEAGVLPALPPSVYNMAAHCVEAGFCTVTGRKLH